MFCPLPCSVSIKSKENQEIISRIVKEVKGLNPKFEGVDIRGNTEDEGKV